ncbi:hypothetical protein WJ967_09315 [Achromobacter xylosoxidans]
MSPCARPAPSSRTPVMSARASGAEPVLRTRTLYWPEVPLNVQTSMPYGAVPAWAGASAAKAAGRMAARRNRDGTVRS